MVPLLEIKSIPIEIQIKTKNASLEFTRGTAEMEVSRTEQGGVNVKSRPIHVRLDSFQNRPDYQPPRGTKPAAPAPAPAANAAPAAASTAAPAAASNAVPATNYYEATSAFADQGQLMLNARIGTAQASTASSQADQTTAQSNQQQSASASNVDLNDSSMEIRFGMDKLNFDWKIERGMFKFIPGDMQITVTQRPDVIIRYTGGPIYFPRSADPNYQPVNTQA